MAQVTVSLHDQIVEISCPPALRERLQALFGDSEPVPGAVRRFITIAGEETGGYSIESEHGKPATGLAWPDLVTHVLEEVVRSLVYDLSTAVALHAASVGRAGSMVLLPGKSGTGKSTLAAWFVERGFDYLSDELAILDQNGTLTGFRRPLIAKPGARDVVGAFGWVRAAATIHEGDNLTVLPPAGSPTKAIPCRLIIFPDFREGLEIAIAPLTPAQATMRLMECNLNARNLRDDGLAAVKALAVGTLAVQLRYGDIDQLDGTVDRLVTLVGESGLPLTELRRLLSAFSGPAGRLPPVPPAPRPIPTATPKKGPAKLTIGMATYDDYDGVYFTIQALRLYHPETLTDTEFLVIDNHPDGIAGEALKKLEDSIPNYRYVPFVARSGTAVRDAIFTEAEGTYVLCLDCHVFVAPGGVRRLLAYFDAHPETDDLLQGPILFDNLTTIATNFAPQWSGGMFGNWDKSEQGLDPDAEPFEIGMQGLGLFACRRAAWLGFNRSFRGFGGEEGYIHEKFRQAGRRTLCLPFLRWLHRFGRPAGTPYSNRWEDRLHNYFVGLTELGLPTTDMERHFNELLGEESTRRILAMIHEDLA